MRKPASFFVSYAHADTRLAKAFMDSFRQQATPSKAFDHRLWRDIALLVGEAWRHEIETALVESDFGLLLLSPAFLGSAFIKDVELPAMGTKPIFPVLLKDVDFKHHDLMGLDQAQIYFQTRQNGHRRAFQDCRDASAKDGFVLELFDQVERRLRKLIA